MNKLALFAGAGGGILGGHLLGWRTVCAVEWADYPRQVLLARQRDRILPRFPIWDDVQTFDGEPWKGRVDIVTGGFPCQDLSSAGTRLGLSGSRSGLWKEMARIIGEVRPRFAFIENSPMLVKNGLGTVLKDLSEMGYDAKWCVLGASDLGGVHKRKRVWILAYSNSKPRSQNDSKGKPIKFKRDSWVYNAMLDRASFSKIDWNLFTTKFHGNSDGVADRVDRLKAIGNGQVPAVAALAFTILSEGII